MEGKIISRVFLILILSVVLIGCNTDTNFPGNDEGKEIEIVESLEISIPIEKIRTLNPILSVDEDAYYLNRLIYQGLFEFNNNLGVFATLVDKHEYTDEVTLVLYLAGDIFWSDGENFTAADVKFSVDAYKSVPSGRQGPYASYVSAIKAVKIVDPHTVEIKFSDRGNTCLENLTFPILPSHMYKKPIDLTRAENKFVPLGTGPYRVESIEEGKQIVLSGNPNYRGKTPENLLKFNFIPRKEDALNLFDMGEANLTYLKNIDRDTLIENKRIKIVSFDSNEVEVLGFNFNHGALQSPNVRHAIAYAIDTEAVLETCYFNSGIINNSIYFPNFLGEDSLGDQCGCDINKAAILLKTSGYGGLSLNLIFNGDNRSRNLAAQLIKSDLEKIGITINLVPLSAEDYMISLEKGDFDIYLGGFKINERYDLRPMLQTKGELNYIGYSNPKIDELLDRMMQGRSRDEKEKTFKSINKLYNNELPYYCLLYKTYGFAASDGLEGDINPYFNNIYNGCDTWKMMYERPVE